MCSPAMSSSSIVYLKPEKEIFGLTASMFSPSRSFLNTFM